MIYVVNKYTHIPTAEDVYIGRPSVLGNPFSHKIGTLAKYKVGTRDEAIAKYREWLGIEYSKRGSVYIELTKLAKLAIDKDVYLVCYCKPLSCHGDIVKLALENIMRRKENKKG